jgi:hypothetical protein
MTRLTGPFVSKTFYPGKIKKNLYFEFPDKQKIKSLTASLVLACPG